MKIKTLCIFAVLMVNSRIHAMGGIYIWAFYFMSSQMGKQVHTDAVCARNFLNNYEPKMVGLDFAEKLLNQHCCPSCACPKLEKIHKDACDHHSKKLIDLHDHCNVSRDFERIKKESIEAHRKNMERIILAKKKCGC